MGKPTNGAPKGSRKSAKKERIRGAVNNYVARRLRELRTERGKTCQEVGRRIGISAASYSGLENGWYRISLDKLFAILKVLGVGVQEIWPLPPPEGNPNGNGSLDGVVARATQRSPELAVEDVLDAVSEAFEVTLEELASKSRWSRLQEARGVCAILAREISGVQFRSLAWDLGCSEAALGRLERRFRKQAQRDGPLAGRIESVRRTLEASTKGTKVHEIDSL
jgi:transcriptional regulator with XRE-family HTH domain